MAKSYYEGDESVITKAGLEPIKASDLQKKFDAVTEAEYDKQRTELQNTENKFYNKLYDTQQTTMDTIRQNNASAVATGASKGIQAANELSALLGLQQESVEGATDIANQATTIAQDETQAMLENVLNAETQAQAANQTLANILVQAGSVDVEGRNADTAAMQVQQQWQQLIEQIRQTNPDLATQLQTAYNTYYTANINTDTDTNTDTNIDTPTMTPAVSTPTTTTDANGTVVPVYSKHPSVSKTATGLDPAQAAPQDFGEYYDTGKPGSKQDTYVRTILEASKNGKIPNGTYVDFNYGTGWVWKTGSVYVYEKGKWYPTNLRRSDVGENELAHSYNHFNIDQLGL